jgi:pectin methylesterase-like acyl-CoA thioesterase
MLTVVLLVASGAVLAQYLTNNVAPMSITVPDDYSTIQVAIGNCTPGSTIHVGNGVYNELLTIDKPLTLIGEDRENTNNPR